ncbi:hypothetical protein ABDK56_09885 [Sphingomonas sp. ASV193]|uniref:hypothetical protein n=1 Tax=Sphingomonas sp. ASV193 TaxID=3144405 RepID=UPI0032E87180
MTWTFGYNAASQLTSESRDNDAYAYTALYNANRSYGINGLNQYISAGSANFTYDTSAGHSDRASRARNLGPAPPTAT